MSRPHVCFQDSLHSYVWMQCVCSKYTVVLSKRRLLTHKVPSCFSRLYTHSRSQCFWDISRLFYSLPAKMSSHSKSFTDRDKHKVRWDMTVVSLLWLRRCFQELIRGHSYELKAAVLLEIIYSRHVYIQLSGDNPWKDSSSFLSVIRNSTYSPLWCYRNSFWCRDMGAWFIVHSNNP